MMECLYGLDIILCSGLFANLCMYLLYNNKNKKIYKRRYYKTHKILQTISAPAA
jgi:hypothetical protein